MTNTDLWKLVGVAIQAVGCIGQIVNVIRMNTPRMFVFLGITWAGVALSLLMMLMD